MKKTYCTNCKFLREILHPTDGFIIGRECLAVKKYKEDFLNKWISYGKPERLNADNNCKYYKRKWYKIFN